VLARRESEVAQKAARQAERTGGELVA